MISIFDRINFLSNYYLELFNNIKNFSIKNIINFLNKFITDENITAKFINNDDNSIINNTNYKNYDNNYSPNSESYAFNSII